MAETEVAPCALCLLVDEIPSMLELRLLPTAGDGGLRRALCSGCADVILAAMQDSETWQGWVRPKTVLTDVELLERMERDLKAQRARVKKGQSTEQISEGGEEVAKDA